MRVGNLNLKELAEYRASVCMIGPQEATELLKRNTKNRKISGLKIAKLSIEMSADEWFATATGIGIDTDGVLTNGQHTLSAIVKSGKTVPVLVVCGLLPISREKEDRGKSRSLFDNFFLSGECGNRKEVEVATFLAKWPGQIGSGGSSGPADSEVKASLEAHRDSIRAITPLFGSNRRGLSQAGVRGALVLAHEIHGQKAIDFANRFLSDLHDRADDPAFRLRKVLLGEASSHGPGFGGKQQVWAFKKTVAAFNAFAKGKRILRLYDAEEIVSA